MRFFSSLIAGVVAFAFVGAMCLVALLAGGAEWGTVPCGIFTAASLLVSSLVGVLCFAAAHANYRPRPPVRPSYELPPSPPRER